MTQLLVDLGEREIVRSIIPQFVSGAGDDCAIVGFAAGCLVLTTDPVPKPAALLIGKDPDLYWMGRLLVTINASDLAASGAHPLAFLAAIDAPSNLPVESLKRLLAGIKDACAAEGLSYSGGNLRESSEVAAVGTAVGFTEKPITRRGAKVGHAVVSIGAGGIFWRDALTLLRGGSLDDRKSSPVFMPHSQLKAMEILNREHLISVAIDNSDGLLPSLKLLAEANGLGIELDLDSLRVPAADGLEIDPARLWLGWGDWNVVAGVVPENLQRASELAGSVGSKVVRVGRFIEMPGEVLLRRGHSFTPAPRLESERFARDSWFSQGIEGYVAQLLSVPLP
jgi:thiamine-monophosphate kinase